MEKMTLGKELSIFFNTLFSNNLSIILLLVLIALAIIFILTNKKNAKVTKRIYIGIYAFIIIFVIVAYNKYILDFIDYMMNNLFIAIYFPNLAIYFAAIIVSNIVVLISIFNFKVTKLIKNINIIMYTIINLLLILLIGVITDKKLDIYSQASIYDNATAHALIELTSIIFVLWMIFLIIYKLIRIYQTNKDGEKLPVKVIEKPVIEEKIVKERILPDNIVEVTIPNFAKKDSLEINLDEDEIEYRTNIEVEKRVNTKIREAHAFDKMLTKEDYIVLLNLLKQNKNNLEESNEDIITEEEQEEIIEEINSSIEENIEEEVVEETTEEEIVEEETVEEEVIEEDEYSEEPKVIKVIDDDQSSYIRLQELYQSVNL